MVGPMLLPMMATLAEAPLDDPALVYEPKYDGIRAVAEVDAGGKSVRLWSRLGNDKATQFPEVVEALRSWARHRKEPVVLDGELVALDANGEPAGFQQLQGRIHLKDQPVAAGPAAFVAFDVLRVGPRDVRDEPLTARRARLEALLAPRPGPLLRLSEQAAGSGEALYAQALARGWEGLIAKRAASKYRSGKRSTDWRKLKIIQEQEFVVAGWTEPRSSRTHFGALLLGVYEDNRLVYAGHTGTGFDERTLTQLMARMAPLEMRECPFAVKPKSNERPHWVRPELVAQIKFTEWTADHHLRHPVFVGLRDDKRARDVVREPTTRHHASVQRRLGGTRGAGHSRGTLPGGGRAASRVGGPDTTMLVAALQALEEARKDGVVPLPDDDTLSVTNLHKVFWPQLALTKGDLFRYYAQVAPFILPVLADRPLVMKRYPNGIEGKPFYQHRAQDAPSGVRVEDIEAAGGRPHLVGGNLKTLMYTCQLAAISQDPWFSRVDMPGAADQVALDLDPSEQVPFSQVLDVARWIRDELQTLGVFSMPKTSGSRGLHIIIPLAPGTPYESGLLFSQLVATLISERHPREATIERAVRGRGRRVYVDYLQNIEGKTLASAYSVRANAHAGVSTPLTWKEVDEGVEREAFTLTTLPARLAQVGDLWEALRSAKGANLRDVTG